MNALPAAARELSALRRARPVADRQGSPQGDRDPVGRQRQSGGETIAGFRKRRAERVFLYPVFVPRAQYGRWLTDYFDLARKTAGVASVFGALVPGSDVMRLPRATPAAAP